MANYYAAAEAHGNYIYYSSFTSARSFVDSFNAGSGHGTYKIYDSDWNQVYPNNIYYVADTFGSTSAVIKTNYTSARQDVISNEQDKVFDPMGNVMYPDPLSPDIGLLSFENSSTVDNEEIEELLEAIKTNAAKAEAIIDSELADD